MTIERDGTGLTIYCDKCPASKHLNTSFFDEALLEANRRGWRASREKGEWVHYCPDHAQPDFPKLD